MKFTINIEATPEEARAFIGLPDVAGMQERLITEMEQKMAQNIRDLDPDTLVKTWVPIMTQSWTDLQKNFWGQMGMGGASFATPGMGGAGDKDDSGNDKK